MSDLTILELATHFKKDRSTVLRWIERGFFPNAVLHKSPAGNFWLVPTTDLENFEQPVQGKKYRGGSGGNSDNGVSDKSTIGRKAA